MIPAGTYPAVAVPVQTKDGPEVSIQFGLSKNDKQQCYVAFEIIRGPQSGQKIGWFGSFSDAAADRTIKSLRYCGFTGDDLHLFAAQRPENEVEIVVDHETFNGKTSAKVNWVNAPGGGNFTMSKPFGDREMRQFGAMLKGKLKGAPPVAGKKAEREAPSAAPTDEWSGNDEPDPPKDNGVGRGRSAPAADDDIPF